MRRMSGSLGDAGVGLPMSRWSMMAFSSSSSWPFSRLRVANVFQCRRRQPAPAIDLVETPAKPCGCSPVPSSSARISCGSGVEVGGVLTASTASASEARLMPVRCSRNRSQRAAARQMLPSIRRVSSIPARCSRSCTAAPNSAACAFRRQTAVPRIFPGFSMPSRRSALRAIRD